MFTPPFADNLTQYCASLETDFSHIEQARKQVLQQLGIWVANTLQKGQPPNVIVICTHNSRRSLMGQVMLTLAAQRYELPQITAWSGGTLATAVYGEVVAAMQRQGIPIEKAGEGENPTYRLLIEGVPAASQTLFSKRFDDEPNPEEGFAAVMVCSDADSGCPLVPGAAARFSLPFEDPKSADEGSDKSQVYDQRLREIGSAFFYAVWEAKQILQSTATPLRSDHTKSA